jgi:hypothetical protein
MEDPPIDNPIVTPFPLQTLTENGTIGNPDTLASTMTNHLVNGDIKGNCLYLGVLKEIFELNIHF